MTDRESIFGDVQGKFEPTIKDSFYADYIYNTGFRWGDINNPDDFSYKNDPNLRKTGNDNFAEGGYVHRFSPEAVFIGYFNWGNANWLKTDSYFYRYFDNQGSCTTFWAITYRRTIQDFNNVQLQQQLKVGDHTFIAGFDYFTGSLRLLLSRFIVLSDLLPFSYHNILSPSTIHPIAPPPSMCATTGVFARSSLWSWAFRGTSSQVPAPVFPIPYLRLPPIHWWASIMKSINQIPYALLTRAM